MTYKNILPKALCLRLQEVYWNLFWKRQLNEQKRVLGFNQAKTLSGSERATLIEAILSNYPFETFLEVGCGMAQNFHILCKIVKDRKLVGVDLDQEKISQGLDLLRVRNFNNVELKQCSGADLKIFPNKSFDIVVSSACLLYLSAENIEFYLRELIRVAKKKIILLEQNTEGESVTGNLYAGKDGLPDYWLRNYFLLFSKIMDKKNISVKKVPHPIWTTEEWQRDAAIIEIDL